jgi:hypothetical protein
MLEHWRWQKLQTRLRPSGRRAVVLQRDAYFAAAQREAMFEIYSFCRQVDDIADSRGPRDQRRRARPLA